jgi:aminomethyltransferase
MATLRRTPLYPAHVRAGAKLTEFAGFEMPLQYSGLLEEHTAVRERAGLFDVSHMGEVVLRGPHAMDALQRLVTNDVAAATDGQAVYAAICNPAGGIVDDVVVYRRSHDDLLVCVNASNRDKDFRWIKEHSRSSGAEILDQGDDYAQLALQGPKAAAILARLTKTDLTTIANYHHRQGEVAGRACLIARTGYTG